MPSLMELVERVNKGELIDSATLEVYEESPNSAEKFLAHHAHAMLDLRRAQQHMLQSLEAIEQFKPMVAGSASTSDQFAEALSRCSALVHVWPTSFAHPIDAVDLPIVRRTGSGPETFIRDAKKPSAQPRSAVPALSAELLQSILISAR